MEISSKQALRIVVKDFTGNLIAIIDDTGSRTYGGATVSIDRPLTDYTTLEDIEKIGSDVLIPRQVAGFLKCSPYSINCQAMQDPSKLGFPVLMVGSRVKIPKAGFLKFCRGIKLDEEVNIGEEKNNT